MRANKFGLADLRQLRQATSTPAKAALTDKLHVTKKRQWQNAAATVSTENKADALFSAHEKDTTNAASGKNKSLKTTRLTNEQAKQHFSISADDHNLFREAMKSVSPIKNTLRAILPPVPAAPLGLLRQRRAVAIGQEHATLTQVSDHYTSARTEHDESTFLRADTSPDLIKGLKRGKWPIGASLDLHGATLDEARKRLDQFLLSCLMHHIKCVRIVHGKGYGSKDGTPVLKQTVRRWLTQLNAVSAYTECAEHDGGAGAVQVLLRVGDL